MVLVAFAKVVRRKTCSVKVLVTLREELFPQSMYWVEPFSVIIPPFAVEYVGLFTSVP